jgi:hypothetical protein
MDEWIDRLAEALEEEPIGRSELGAVLKLARDVAHGVERKLAPVSTFMAGVYVGHKTAAGMPREEALRRFLETAAMLIPDQPAT